MTSKIHVSLITTLHLVSGKLAQLFHELLGLARRELIEKSIDANQTFGFHGKANDLFDRRRLRGGAIVLLEDVTDGKDAPTDLLAVRVHLD